MAVPSNAEVWAMGPSRRPVQPLSLEGWRRAPLVIPGLSQLYILPQAIKISHRGNLRPSTPSRLQLPRSFFSFSFGFPVPSSLSHVSHVTHPLEPLVVSSSPSLTPHRFRIPQQAGFPDRGAVGGRHVDGTRFGRTGTVVWASVVDTRLHSQVFVAIMDATW